MQEDILKIKTIVDSLVLFDDFNGAVVENVFIILGILLFLDSIFKRRKK
jgi:hypothetical protein